MQKDQKSVLLASMPCAGLIIPSIQLALLESYLKKLNIDVKTCHLYLKASMFYGVNNYDFLINSPNDSYTAQMIFSKYVFPEHWEKNKDKLREYFQKTNSMSKNHFTFNEYIKCSDDFYDWVLCNLPWQDYDIIGFTLNYGQFLPSLAIAKEIKKQNNEKIIILGGSRTTGNLGVNVLKLFPYIDFIVSGDGEEALYLLADDYQNYESIPNLIYRKQNEIVWNQSEKLIDLNKLPIPVYDSFYDELSRVSPEIQQFFYYHGKLPIEISRGCFWNKCTFCNLNIQQKKYREKNIDKIVEEIDFLSTKHKILDFQLIGNTLPKYNTKIFCQKIKHLGKDFTFFAEARANQLKSEDYYLLKEAGFNSIQTGIESFSQKYLMKINKGTRVIDNIAALKFCKENGIANKYNIIINYPNEKHADFEETKKNIQLFKQYLDFPQLCYLRVVYGSPIYCNPKQFNISELDYAYIDKLMFPQEFLDKGICFVYSFQTEKSKSNEDWKKLVDNWKIEREMLQIEGINSQNLIDKLIFYFVDGGSFVKIYDKRSLNNIQIYTLNEVERDLFLSCINIISIEELKEKFSNISENDLKCILDNFEETGIVYREDSHYLSLPLNYGKCFLIDKKTNIESSEDMIEEEMAV